MISDWDDAYNNRGHIEDAETFVQQWPVLAEQFRQQKLSQDKALLDLEYGAGEREKMDIFLPDGDPKGLMVFVHGGYWLMFDKSSWSHLARGGVERGWAVMLPSYTLCPDNSVSGITRQVASAIDLAAERIAGPVRLSGHSAGGHVVSRMCCDPSPLSARTRDRLDRVASISGLHDLRPMIRTSMNENLKLDAIEAASESAALHVPLSSVAVRCWVGADERPEFVRQADLLANIWTGCGIDISAHHAPGKHHFSVIDELTEPNSGLVDFLLS